MSFPRKRESRKHAYCGEAMATILDCFGCLRREPRKHYLKLGDTPKPPASA
jgi:hypothetical protein